MHRVWPATHAGTSVVGHAWACVDMRGRCAPLADDAAILAQCLGGLATALLRAQARQALPYNTAPLVRRLRVAQERLAALAQAPVHESTHARV